MDRRLLASAFIAVALTACGDNGFEHDSRPVSGRQSEVSSRWKRSEDPIDGPKGYVKYVTYDVEQSEYPLLLSCAKTGLAANITIDRQESRSDLPLAGTIRLDDGAPEPQEFLFPQGSTAIWPGGIDDTTINTFISKLEGHQNLAVRLDGLESDFPPVVFNIRGVDKAIKEIREQCKSPTEN